MGVKVTVLASHFVRRGMESNNASPAPEGLTFAYFSDGYDNGVTLSMDLNHFRSEFKSRSTKAMVELITASANEGLPIICVVYGMLLSWAAQVARDFNITSAPLWVQPAAIFDIYYYYFNGHGDEIRKISTDNSSSSQVTLAGLPPLTRRDLPTYMLPSKSANPFALPAFEEQLETLDAELKKPTVLVNTFDSLEEEALGAIDKYNLFAIGPLIPQALLDGKDNSDTTYGCDLVQKSRIDGIVEWLDAKPRLSVVYVSFGSFLGVSDQQMEEIARGLLESQRPFLWVIKDTENGNKLSCREELERQGMIVPWCSQVEVLSHPSSGCFVTHCGWNSSLETLACGVPVVGLPLFTDQPINAKLLVDTFKIGVRLTVNEQGIAERDEVKRCIEVVMGEGEKREEIRRNAEKWKELAKDATKEGGSSHVNLKAFVGDF
ncbi:hypothetical protein Vadar_017305 [Vaccinium darrowii]|uniref:Uncharacterized protein n=1 Tax=Vaccinium darrowii TaxID=229202 RepID=A0ACB7YEI9_9ERIC|nr:hypothetical protein Vadar_017305 [Vaccinium darrowii]